MSAPVQKDRNTKESKTAFYSLLEKQNHQVSTLN
jgi:hypothetical protein